MELEEDIERLTLKAITSSVDAPDYPNCIVMKKDLILLLNHLTKQEKMIELLIEDLQGEGCFNMSREEIDNYYERRILLGDESNVKD